MATSAAATFAEWTAVSETNDLRVYIDFKEIRKDGNLRRVWELQNMKQRNKLGAMSSRARVEYDCKNERTRILSLSLHSESMTGGEVLFSGGADPNGWAESPPGTPVAIIMKIVCSN